MSTFHQDAVQLFPENEAVYSSIGRFMAEFSQLEFTLKYAVAKAVSLPETHLDAVMTHDVALLCTVAQNVFATCLRPDEITELTGLISKIRQLNAERVRVAHGLWVVSPEGGKLYHVSRDKLRSRTHFEEPRGRAIARLADQANQLRSGIDQLLWAYTASE